MVENDHGADSTPRSFTPMADTCRQPGSRLATLAADAPADIAATVRVVLAVATPAARAPALAATGDNLATAGARCRP